METRRLSKRDISIVIPGSKSSSSESDDDFPLQSPLYGHDKLKVTNQLELQLEFVGRRPEESENSTRKDGDNVQIEDSRDGTMDVDISEPEQSIEDSLSIHSEHGERDEDWDKVHPYDPQVVPEHVHLDSVSDVDSDSTGEIRKTDHFGIFLTSDRAKPISQVSSPIISDKGSMAKRQAKKDAERATKWLNMQQKWDDVAKKRRGLKMVKRRARKGIPDTVRGEMWQLLSGSKKMLNDHPKVYTELIESNVPVDGPIEEDIPRTMFDHEMFCKRSRLKGHSKLRRVLLAYGRYDREVQYCQGINYIAALFLLYMAEEEAFWMLVCVMKRSQAPLRLLFLPGMVAAREFHFVMDSLTLKFVPKLYRHLKQNDIDPTMYAHPWFVTCFTQSFPYDLVTRVWDVFLKEDFKIMYRVCLALFKFVEDEVCKLDLERGNMVMRRLPASVESQVIMDIALKIPLKHRHVTKRIQIFNSKK